MNYKIMVMPTALAELDEAFRWLVVETVEHAPKWYNGVLDAIYSLEEFPARCPVAPEAADAGEEVRQLLYGDRRHAYRILFIIQGETVLILHIRHASRKGPSKGL